MILGPRLRTFAIPVLLILATLLTRWPFRTTYLFMWDSANFALALDHYDVTQHRPHPPGYFFFVAVGRALLPVVGDANTAFVVEALTFSALAVAALYFLGRSMYGERVGLAAALLLLGSVTFWSFGGLALAYPSLAFFSTLAALLSYRVLFLKEDRLVALAGVYALGGGFRPDLMLFLGPLCALCWLRNPWRRKAVALAVAGAAGLAWLVPTVVLSGGLDSYLSVLSAYSGTDVLDRYSVLRRGLPALVNNTGDTIAYTFYALYGTVLLIPGAALGWAAAWRRARRDGHLSGCLETGHPGSAGASPARAALAGEAPALPGRPPPTFGQVPLVQVSRRPGGGEGWKAAFLVLWIAPMVLFYLVIHIGYPGYVFSFLPAVLLTLARGWFSLPLGDFRRGRRRALLWGAVIGVLVVNSAVFLFHPRPLTAPGLWASDAAMAARLELIRHADPEQTVLVSYESFKHLAYYVPDYRRSIWVDIFAPEERGYPLPPAAQQVLIVDASLVAITGNLPGTTVPLAGNEKAKRVLLPASSGQRFLVYRNGTLQVSAP